MVAPGYFAVENDRLLMGFAHGTALDVHELQMEGKKRMSAQDFINGYRPKSEEKLAEHLELAASSYGHPVAGSRASPSAQLASIAVASLTFRQLTAFLCPSLPHARLPSTFCCASISTTPTPASCCIPTAWMDSASDDRGLATELVMGVLRWRSRLDEDIVSAAARSTRQARFRSPHRSEAWRVSTTLSPYSSARRN